MYLRADWVEHSIPALRQFIKENPFGIFITALKSANFPTIQCTHFPWLLDVENDKSETELGTLRGHFAKMNPQAKALMERVPTGTILDEEVSIMFNGPVNSYVTPQFYVDSKPSTGKVAPTWNYSAVQAYGRAKIYHDSKAPETYDYLQKQITDLSHHGETKIMGFSKPWAVKYAPEEYIDALRKNIIGVVVEITRLEGKFKMSQERNAVDRKGVIDGFQSMQTEVGSKIADTIKWRAELKDDSRNGN